MFERGTLENSADEPRTEISSRHELKRSCIEEVVQRTLPSSQAASYPEVFRSMNRFESFLIGLAAGIATLYLVMHFTVVRANDGFHWIPKVSAKLDLPYEDVRDFKSEHWQRRPGLTMSILRARKGYLIDDRTQRQFQQATNQMISQARSAGQPSGTRSQASGPIRSASSSMLAGSASTVR